eukprot:258284-Hanusia_phi.AAC.1
MLWPGLISIQCIKTAVLTDHPICKVRYCGMGPRRRTVTNLELRTRKSHTARNHVTESARVAGSRAAASLTRRAAHHCQMAGHISDHRIIGCCLRQARCGGGGGGGLVPGDRTVYY